VWQENLVHEVIMGFNQKGFNVNSSIEETKEEGSNKYLAKIFLDVKELPSKGLSYPKDCEVYYKPFTFGELEVINQGPTNVKKDLELVLEGIECSFNKLDLTGPDFLYIAFLRKISTLNTKEVIISYQCNLCGQKNRHIQPVDKFEFEELQVPELPIIADLRSGTYEFMPLTVKNFLNMLNKGNEKSAIWMLAYECSSHNTKEAYEAFYGACLEDGKILREVDKLLYHSVKPIDTVCTSKNEYDEECGNQIILNVEDLDNLILPFRGSERTPESAIRFGTKTPHKSSSSKADGLSRSQVHE
jgi:hypothetical protein